eukprot:SAG11_NODE_1026_length_6141_cov_13.737008_6_plen_58_part_00
MCFDHGGCDSPVSIGVVRCGTFFAVEISRRNACEPSLLYDRKWVATYRDLRQKYNVL